MFERVPVEGVRKHSLHPEHRRSRRRKVVQKMVSYDDEPRKAGSASATKADIARRTYHAGWLSRLDDSQLGARERIVSNGKAAERGRRRWRRRS